MECFPWAGRDRKEVAPMASHAHSLGTKRPHGRSKLRRAPKLVRAMSRKALRRRAAHELAAFEGAWRLQAHDSGYDRWLALKGVNPVARRFAAGLSATRTFALSPDGRSVTHIYRLAGGALEVRQVWTPFEEGREAEEAENGQVAWVRSRWEPGRRLVVTKRFEARGLDETVDSRVSPDGATLQCTMTTRRRATGEERATTDTFLRA